MMRRFEEAEGALRIAAEVGDVSLPLALLEVRLARIGEPDDSARALAAAAVAVPATEAAIGYLPSFAPVQVAYLDRAPDAVERLRAFLAGPAATAWTEHSYSTQSRIVDAPLAVLVARKAWALGDAAYAASLVPEFRPALLLGAPELADAGRLPGRAGRDLFGRRSAVWLTEAWEHAFRGEREAALVKADSAVALFPVEYDATDGVEHFRERALIRVVAGDLDGAVADLAVLLEAVGGLTRAEVRADPIFDRLRDREDFQALVGGEPAPGSGG